VIAGIAIASGLDRDVGALSIAYVLVLAVAGPVIARVSEPIADRLLAVKPGRARGVDRPNTKEQQTPGRKAGRGGGLQEGVRPGWRREE
jgi:CPA2 family monovalent cation:H+ antiporter-2